VIQRGDIWWADLDAPRRSEPGFRRPVLVLQADAFNRSRLSTVVVAALTSNLALTDAPGNVLLPAGDSDLPRDSVVNVSQLLTLDRRFLAAAVGRVPGRIMEQVEAGVRVVLGL
jgi:mRNA interferase MazF